MDPRTGGVVARAASSSHPLRHAVMLCIDAVAHSQGGGAWDAPCLGGDGNSKEMDRGGIAISETAMAQVPPEKKRRLDSYLCSEYDMFVSREPCIM